MSYELSRSKDRVMKLGRGAERKYRRAKNRSKSAASVSVTPIRNKVRGVNRGSGGVATAMAGAAERGAGALVVIGLSRAAIGRGAGSSAGNESCACFSGMGVKAGEVWPGLTAGVGETAIAGL